MKLLAFAIGMIRALWLSMWTPKPVAGFWAFGVAWLQLLFLWAGPVSEVTALS